MPTNSGDDRRKENEDLELKKNRLEVQKLEAECLPNRIAFWIRPSLLAGLAPIMVALVALFAAWISGFFDRRVAEAEQRVKQAEERLRDLNTKIGSLEAQGTRLKDSHNLEMVRFIAQKQDSEAEANKLWKEKVRLEKDVAEVTLFRDALEDKGIAESRATMTLLLVLQQFYNDPDAQHVVKKILLVQTLGRMVFASSPEARKAAVQNWIQLDHFLRTGPWFPKEVLDKYKNEIETIISERASFPEKKQGLIKISKRLREAIGQFEERKYLAPIGPMKAHWFAQAEKAAERLAAAAKESRKPDGLYWNQFWSMYCCELILVEGSKVESAMVDFGKLLEEWEKSPDRPELRTQVEGGLKTLQAAFEDERKRIAK